MQAVGQAGHSLSVCILRSLCPPLFQFMHRHKEEMHTARISLVSVILVLVCWLPYYVVGLFAAETEPVVAATDGTDHLW